MAPDTEAPRGRILSRVEIANVCPVIYSDRVRILRSVPTVWGGWVIARLALMYTFMFENNPIGDVWYYHHGVFGDDPTAMTEYPDAGTWPSTLLAYLIGENVNAYFIAFPVMVLCFDALFMALLLRRRTVTPAAVDAAWLWVFFGTAAGQVFVMRLDIFPALLVAAAGYFLFKHPGFSGFFLAFATAMKLWPGILAAGIVGSARKARTWLALLGFVGGMALFVGITAMVSGVDRVISPLTYQTERGLQIESVAATPFVVHNYFDPQRWDLAYSGGSKSFEVTGPGVEVAILLTTTIMAFTVLFALGWALYRFICGRWTPQSTLAFFVMLILLLLVGNKVFSTQYITWLGPILMVAVARGDQPRGQRVLIRIIAVFAVCAAAMGTVVYPFKYNQVWNDEMLEPFPVAALAVRNALIVLMAILALVWFVLSCRKPVADGTPGASAPAREQLADATPATTTYPTNTGAANGADSPSAPTTGETQTVESRP